MKIRLAISLLALFFVPLLVQATHIAGGYISYIIVDPQNPLTYNFRLTLVDDDRSTVEDPTADLSMGDGTTLTVDRKSSTPYGNYHSVSIYEWEHSYQQQGTYTVSWNGINRNWGIVNIPANSDQVSQYVYTQVQASFTNVNSHSVRTIVPAPVEAYAGEPFHMNLIAYDADGDKLTYELVPSAYVSPEGVAGAIPGYQFPAGLTVSKFGELNWQNPGAKGEYALAMRITEFRDGQAIGYSIVDMQLNVMERSLEPQVTLLNKDRLAVNDDGSIWARPNQPLKLEFYVGKPANSSLPISVAQFSDLDTLDLASPALAARDTANGLAVTVTFTPGAELAREEAYILGLRGGTPTNESDNMMNPQYMYNWAFAYIVVGEQQPTAASDDVAEAGFSLYPNPVYDRFILETPNLPALRLQLRDLTGKLIQELPLTSGRNQLTKPAGMASGIYFYTISSRHNPVGSGKLLVR